LIFSFTNGTSLAGKSRDATESLKKMNFVFLVPIRLTREFSLGLAVITLSGNQNAMAGH
jgi:hypothetical protein